MHPCGRPTQWLSDDVALQVEWGVVSERDRAVAALVHPASPEVTSARPFEAHVPVFTRE